MTDMDLLEQGIISLTLNQLCSEINTRLINIYFRTSTIFLIYTIGNKEKTIHESKIRISWLDNNLRVLKKELASEKRKVINFGYNIRMKNES